MERYCMSYGNDCFVVHYSTSTWSQAMQLSWKGSQRKRRRTWNRNRVSAHHQFCQSTIKKVIFETFRSRMIAVTSNWRKERFTSAKTSIQQFFVGFFINRHPRRPCWRWTSSDCSVISPIWRQSSSSCSRYGRPDPVQEFLVRIIFKLKG